jgi:hypothetical protein
LTRPQVGYFEVAIGDKKDPKELTIPYYFLLMGAGPNIHISFTCKYEFDDIFMRQEKILAKLDLV